MLTQTNPDHFTIINKSRHLCCRTHVPFKLYNGKDDCQRKAISTPLKAIKFYQEMLCLPRVSSQLLREKCFPACCTYHSQLLSEEAALFERSMHYPFQATALLVLAVMDTVSRPSSLFHLPMPATFTTSRQPT